eukprot:m.188576 g.188576  ORF g.188576 m.188576 type:complete len:174 (+) comp25645_c0_seq7:544-1065(+)
MKALKTDVEALKKVFFKVRNHFMETELDNWIAANSFFPTPVQAVQEIIESQPEKHKVYIITTKAKPFAVKLIQEAKLNIPEDRVFGLGSGKKEETIAKLLKDPANEKFQTCVFVEDRLPTLMRVRAREDLSNVGLVLASWGYNSSDQHQLARQNNIKVFNEDEFSKFLVEAGP